MVKHAYAVGRVRALEARLLDQNHLSRMVEAPSFEAVYKFLEETTYAEKIDKLEHAFDFEGLLRLELISLQELMDRLAPGQELLKVMFAKYDLPEEDYFLALNQTAQKHRVPLFTRYAQGYTLLFRLKKQLLSGPLESEKIMERYRYTDFNRVVASGLEHYQQTGELYVFEREIDNFLMGILKKAKYRVMGIEPLIGFVYAKEIEIKLLRLILTGKLLQIKIEDLKERLRLPYV
jgi:vacuolar-type H+-ATPase subunit C/Vma6